MDERDTGSRLVSNHRNFFVGGNFNDNLWPGRNTWKNDNRQELTDCTIVVRMRHRGLILPLVVSRILWLNAMRVRMPVGIVMMMMAMVMTMLMRVFGIVMVMHERIAIRTTIAASDRMHMHRMYGQTYGQIADGEKRGDCAFTEHDFIGR